MAADDNKPPLNNPPNKPLDDDEVFVDRDDDSNTGFVDRDYVDRDYADGYAEGSDSTDDTGPDPGYAAFASELEDPLADWPAPDTSLEDLPEVRMRDDASTGRIGGDVAEGSPEDNAGDSSGYSAGDSADSNSENAAWESISANATPDPLSASLENNIPSMDVELAFGDDDVSDADPMTRDRVDVDRADPVDELAIDPGDQDRSSTEARASNEIEQRYIAQSYDEIESLGLPSEPAVPEPPDVPLAPAPPLDDELVDDFLNDLDPPSDDDGLEEGENIDRAIAFSSGGLSDRQAADEERGGSRQSVELAGSSLLDDQEDPLASRDEQIADYGAERSPPPEATISPDNDERSLPLGMIGIVALALVLLGVGGYGVIKQRSDLQNDIRDLQAQLATTMTADDAATERERQRQVELLNESLTAEVEALTAENAELSNQLNALEAQYAAQLAAAEAARNTAEKAAEQAAATVARERAATRETGVAGARNESSTGAGATSTSAAEPGGPWFVNFGSYAQNNVAERWAKELKVNDGRVVVQTATAAGKTLYRVRVIGLKDQDEAERIATALERQYQLPRLWVGKNG